MRCLAVLMTLFIGGCVSSGTIIPDNSQFVDMLYDTSAVILMPTLNIPMCGGTVVKYKNFVGVLTAHHCVSDSETKVAFDEVTFEAGKQVFKGFVAKSNSFMDLALILPKAGKIDAPRAPISEYELRVMQEVVAIGAPCGSYKIITKGMASGLNMLDHYDYPRNVVQLTAWYGNSGGGVYNSDGEIVGVVSQFGHCGVIQGWFYIVTVKDIRTFLYED